MPVSPISAALNVLNQRHASGATEAEQAQEAQFKDFLTQAIGQAELTGEDNAAFTDALLMGELNNLHDAPIAAREAELALSLTVQIRDRMVEAYQEIMRMQV